MRGTSVLFPLAGKRVLVTGHSGMVGSALVRRLKRADCEVLMLGRETADLRRQAESEAALAKLAPDGVFIASARVGGILANSTHPADFIYDNLMIAANLIEGARRVGVKKLMFLGSSCIYPRLAQQPIQERELLSGPLEPTNQWYAVAKIAGLKLCEAYRKQYGCDFISAQPTNLYGPGDNFDLEQSHVIPALIAKVHNAKVNRAPEVVVWGTGKPRREFLHVDDLADALVFLMERYSSDGHVNVGCGEDVRISEVALMVADAVGFRGEFAFDTSKPDGPPRKLLDVSVLSRMGWHSRIGLREGLADAYDWFVKRQARG